ncbi:MAG: hypothetical protein AB7S26_01255 [Sandaracinaceae bacterium]
MRGRSIAWGWATCALAVTLTLGPRGAHAQAEDGLTQAEALISDAEFDAARAQLDELGASGALAREEVVRWLELRALLEFAVSGGAAPMTLLLGLVSLEPAYELAPTRPPELRTALTEARVASHGTLRQSVSAQRIDGVVVLRAEVGGDPAALVRESRIHARVEGDAEWRTSSSGRLEVATGGRAVRYYATAIGPGGAILARDGSEGDPRIVAAVPDEESPRARILDPGPVVEHAPEDLTGLWVGLGIGLAVLAAVGITLGIVLSQEPDSPLGRPMFPMLDQ